MGKACAGHDNHLAVVAGEGRLRSIRALMPHECFVPKPEQPLLQQRLHAQTTAHQQSSFRNEQGFEGRGTARQCKQKANREGGAHGGVGVFALGPQDVLVAVALPARDPDHPTTATTIQLHHARRRLIR